MTDYRQPTTDHRQSITDYRLRDARALLRHGNAPAACAVFEEYVEEHPQDAEALYDLASCLSGMREYSKAWGRAQEALCLRRDDAMTWNLLATLSAPLGCPLYAERCYLQALMLAPNSPMLRWNYALWQIQHGEWARGWAGYQWGKAAGFRPVRMIGEEWDGQVEMNGKTLFIWAEQGLGDSIMAMQFLNYIRFQFPFVKIVLEVQEPLVRLVRESKLADVVFPTSPIGAVPEHFDAHISLMSLPSLYLPSPDFLPANDHYLRDVGAEVHYYEQLSEYSTHFKIGLVWAGNPNHANDWHRSVEPKTFLPLLDIDGATFFSFQHGWEPERVQLELPGVIPLAHEFRDMGDTVGALRQMDLLITVDTSVAHLAGAAGVATWMLTPFLSDYRWLTDRTDSPWYPTMQLFRQTEIGRWDNVMERMRELL